MTVENGSGTTQAEVAERAPLIDVDVPETPSKPAPAAEAQKTDRPAATDETAEAETPEQQELKKESRRQRKLNRERDARVAAETENRLLKEQIAARDAKANAQAASDEPKREDFEDYESFLRAVTKYDAKQETAAALKAEREANQGKEKQTKQNAEYGNMAKAWDEREKAFIGTNKDYEATVSPYIDDELGQLSDGARRLIVDSEVGPALLHYLAKNGDVHDRIAELPPHRQLAELGKLEDGFEKPEGSTEKAATRGKLISDAPAPIRPANGGKSTTTGYRDDMSTEQYSEWKKSVSGSKSSFRH